MQVLKKSDDEESNFEKRLKNCLKIAESIDELAMETMATLYAETEQISRIHKVAAHMDHHLSTGERGIFFKRWKLKKSCPITGPITFREGIGLEREELGLTSALEEPTTPMQKVEVKKDDALSDISDILGNLMEMAIDMGCELDRQNKALDHVHDDVEEINFREKGANQRTRHRK